MLSLRSLNHSKVKIRQQGIQGKKLVSPITITKQIYQKGGIFSSNGLYRGFFTQMARGNRFLKF